MSVLSILDRITGRQRERERASLSEFDALVKQICDGKQPSEDAVDAALRIAGKSLEDLAAAVERLNRRRTWAATIAKSVGVDTALAALNDRQAKADKALEEATLQHAREVNPIIAERQKLAALESAAMDARRELQATANPDLKTKVKAIAEKREALTADLNAERAARERALVCEQTERGRSAEGGDHATEYAERAEGHKASAANHAEAIARIEGEIAKLDAEEKRVRELMLAP